MIKYLGILVFDKMKSNSGNTFYDIYIYIIKTYPSSNIERV